MNLPIYSSEDDINLCEEIVRKFLDKDKVIYADKQLRDITIDVMNISYSHGGGYTKDIILGFCQGYFSKKLYQKFVD